MYFGYKLIITSLGRVSCSVNNPKFVALLPRNRFYFDLWKLVVNSPSHASVLSACQWQWALSYLGMVGWTHLLQTHVRHVVVLCSGLLGERYYRKL